MIIPSQRSLFDIPENITYLNCASMAPLLKSVSAAGEEGINLRSAPWKIQPGQWFEPAEELKSLFAKIINTSKESIALIPSASYGLAVAKKNIQLRSFQNILILDQQYPSNVYVWRELSKETGANIITVKKERGQTWTEAILAAANEQTGLIAIPNCHWTDGSLIDLIQVSQKSKSLGAKLVIDASQSVGAFPLDVEKIKPDFLVTVGYKWLLGPYGLGYLYVDEKYFDQGKPIEYSWLNKRGSEDFSSLVNYTDSFKAGARRFDAGEFPSFIHIPMARAALTQILNWGVENIQETLSILTTQIARRALEKGFEAPSENNRVGHMIGIRSGTNQAISKKLIANQIFLSFRGTSMRIAPHLYNDNADIDNLVECL